MPVPNVMQMCVACTDGGISSTRLWGMHFLNARVVLPSWPQRLLVQ